MKADKRIKAFLKEGLDYYTVHKYIIFTLLVGVVISDFLLAYIISH